ncbi:hypothetical protein B0J11DRAFT_586376 [Dendryphion nanum]|uniref:Uncharacterized protein n=1 Tax=Dendryphion nanum TaxID=256645 RepID=A0A9P9I7G6_9PLEO|nr:hypothetical protein B0J11DRAFT_586376 [Dendryphion nanum]
MRRPPLKPVKPAHLTSTASHLTRELVLKVLQDSDAVDEEYRAQYERLLSKRIHNAPMIASGPVVEGLKSQAAGKYHRSTLQDLREWLDHLADEQQSNIDMASECGKEISTLRCTRHSLPSKDKIILDRISKGLGPRDVVREDLLTPFREFDPKKGFRDLISDYGSYVELLEMLQAWNAAAIQKKYGHGGKAENVSELIGALGVRTRALVRAVEGRGSSTMLNTRVVQAIHAVYPETVDFLHKDPYSLVAMIIANRLVAEPDLQGTESALLDTMIANLLIESLFHVNNADLAEQLRTAAEMKWVRQRRDIAEMERIRRKRFGKVQFNKAGKVVLDDLKRARRNLYMRKLKELQSLAIAQTSQKWYLENSPHVPSVILQEQCEDADSQLSRILRERMDTVEPLQESTHSKIESLKELGNRCYLRTRRFSALDRPEEERQHVLEERMGNPETSAMMMAVVDETRDIQRSITVVFRGIDHLEGALQDIWEAARYQLQTYEDVHVRANGGQDVDDYEFEFEFED